MMWLAVVVLALVASVVSCEELTALSREKRSSEGYGHQPTYHQPSYKPSKKCYQCAYSPPKTVYEKYQTYQQSSGYGQGGHGGGGYGGGGYGGGHGGGYGGGYVEQTRQATVNGGWDKCLGPFDHYQAKAYGVDMWDCHYNNCYIRYDHNGDIFRGCYKGEYGVDQNLLGCHYQGGSTYCFCEGELCNNGAAGGGGH